MGRPEMERIREQLRLAFEGPAWHGPSVLEALNGVTAAQASARPIGAAHSIEDLTLHLSGTYALVLRRLRGDGRQLAPEEDWPMPSAPWPAPIEMLKGLHEELMRALATFPEQGLDAPLVRESPYTAYTQFIGVTQHNLYHAGQIALLKKPAP